MRARTLHSPQQKNFRQPRRLKVARGILAEMRMIDRLADVVNDFRISLDDRDFWFKYALADVSRIYTRTRFGIFWEMFGPAVFVFVIGLSYSRLIGYQTSEYLPHLALGYILWLNMQMHVVSSCNLFLKYRSVILGAKRPIFSFILRHYVTAMIYSLVHLLLMIPIVFFIFESFQKFRFIWFICYFLLFNTAAISITVIISVLSLRVRDIPHLVMAVTRLAFFVTPILWMERNLGVVGSMIIDLNPFAYFLDGLRNAILGKDGSFIGLGVVGVMTITMLFASVIILAWAKPKLTRWL